MSETTRGKKGWESMATESGSSGGGRGCGKVEDMYPVDR